MKSISSLRNKRSDKLLLFFSPSASVGGDRSRGRRKRRPVTVERFSCAVCGFCLPQQHSCPRKRCLTVFYCIVTGSRSFEDYPKLCERLDYFMQRKQKVIIVSGGARGADSLAEWHAQSRGFRSVVIKADLDKWGTSAGFKLNRQMFEFIKGNPNMDASASGMDSQEALPMTSSCRQSAESLAGLFASERLCIIFFYIYINAAFCRLFILRTAAIRSATLWWFSELVRLTMASRIVWRYSSPYRRFSKGENRFFKNSILVRLYIF